MASSTTTDGETSEPTARRRRGGPRRRRRRGLTGLVLLLLVLAGIALVLLALPLVHAKSEADAAQSDLEQAKTALADHQVGRARTLVGSARDHVDAAQAAANGFGSDVWSVVPMAGGAVDDARHLVDALSETTAAAELGVDLYPMVSSDASRLMKGQSVDLPVLDQVVARTTALGGHLDAAVADLDEVSASTPVVGRSVAHAKDTALGYLLPLQESYRHAGPLVESLPWLVGQDGPRTYLLAMLNPSEQRYSGGGALSFTSITFDHGTARFGTTVDVNEIIQQGETQVWRGVTGNVFHGAGPARVANATFSPWWSVSSEELLRGYQKAFPGQHFDGLIGIDLQGLAAMFRITGPVQLPDFGTISADNLVSTLAGSYDKFTTTEQRKQLNTELVPAFRDKFFTGGRMKDKVQALVDSAKGRHFFVYFRDRHIQRRFAHVGLSGNLSYTFNDYVGVFTQNTNGSKADYWQHRAITDQVALRPNGSALVRLHVDVQNRAPAYPLPGPDPGTGYLTRILGAQAGIFLPNHTRIRSMAVDGRPEAPTIHVPRVPSVHNRIFVARGFLLGPGDTWTADLTYVVRDAAERNDDGTLTYRLDVDPQPLVTPETLDVTVTWPKGWHATGNLPAGWTATPGGARRQGPLPDVLSAAIPLAKG